MLDKNSKEKQREVKNAAKDKSDIIVIKDILSDQMDVFKKMFEKLIENNKESSNNQLNESLVIGMRDKESKVKESIDTDIIDKECLEITDNGENIKEINAVHKVIVEKMKFELEKRDNEMREMKRDILNMKEFIETITNQDNKKTKMIQK